MPYFWNDEGVAFGERQGVNTNKTVTVEFQVYHDPEFLGWEIRTPVREGGTTRFFYLAMARIKETLESHGYDFELTDLSYLDSGWFRGTATKQVDPTLLYTIGDVALGNMSSDYVLADAMNRAGTFAIPPANWRIQRYWDGDLDETVAVHNGERWVSAYKRASGWNAAGRVTGRMVTQEPVDAGDYLESKEQD